MVEISDCFQDQNRLIWLRRSVLILSTLSDWCKAPVWRCIIFSLHFVRELRKLAGLSVFWFAVTLLCWHQYLALAVILLLISPKELIQTSDFILKASLTALIPGKNTFAFCCPLVSFFVFFFSLAQLLASLNLSARLKILWLVKCKMNDTDYLKESLDTDSQLSKRRRKTDCDHLWSHQFTMTDLCIDR